MLIPLNAIGQVIKGLIGLFNKLAIPLAAFIAGKREAERKQLKQEAKNAKTASKLDDGISRASDDALDSILHD